VRLFREAADAGQPVAAYELALDYLDGRGVPADPKQAIDLLRKSSDAGNGFAKYRLAVEEVNGTDIPADYQSAAGLFADAAAAGVSESLTELGKMNYRGQLGAADYAKAFDYFQQAAAKDVASGSFYVGFMEALGYGENPTPQDAVSNMMKALLAGDYDAKSIIVDDQGKAFGLPVRKAIQEYLRREGYFKGKSDGTLGTDTQSAIAAWMAAKGQG
jgi:localization factor PodJL